MNSFKIFTSILFLTFTFLNSTFSQTTQEEYNYLTKGYKTQIESGLDMKKGYSFTELGEQAVTTGAVIRKCNFKALLRAGQTKPCAILCIYSRSDNNFSDYLCIPSSDAPKEIWDQAFVKFNTYTDTGATTLIWGLSKLSAFYSGK